VVRGHLVVAQPLAQLVGHPLGELPRVDEDQRGSVLGDVVADAVEDLAELITRQRGLELAVGELQCQLQMPLMSAVDNRGERLAGTDQ